MVIHNLVQCAFYLTDAFFQVFQFHYDIVAPNATTFQLEPSYTAKHLDPPLPFEQNAKSPSSLSDLALSCVSVCGFSCNISSMLILPVVGSSVRSVDADEFNSSGI